MANHDDDDKDVVADNFDDDDNDDDDDDDKEANSNNNSNSSTRSSNGTIELSELVYSLESFGVIVTPVTITMIISALAVVFINTPETIEAGEDAYNQIFNIHKTNEEDDDESTSTSTSFQKVGFSLMYTLIIVVVICIMTFLIVLCYKYKNKCNCGMRFLYGYLVLVTISILGYFTSQMLLVALSIYPWMSHIDKFSFAFLIYNYAIVGTIAIFVPNKGIPPWLTQGYLIMMSVCLAWQLSYFNAWMAWTLLVMLALYDLFAVLTPCGPLKALANLISQEGAPALPGLLYEANLPNGVSKKKSKRRRPDNQTQQQHHRHQPITVEEPEERKKEEEKQPEQREDNIFYYNSNNNDIDDNHNEDSSRNYNYDLNNDNNSVAVDILSPQQQQQREQEQEHQSVVVGTPSPPSPSPPQVIQHDNNDADDIDDDLNVIDMTHTGQVPLVLAKLYRLDVLDTNGLLLSSSSSPSTNNDNNDDTNNRPPRNDSYYTSDKIRSSSWTPLQLRTEITCIFPSKQHGHRSGTIKKAVAKDQKYDAGVAYIVYDRFGNEEKKFVVTNEGKVMQVLKRADNNDDDDEYNADNDNANNTIKLGLGDFIFYSVLVSKAAQYSFPAFVACLLVVLTGLAVTLLLLAMNGKALPALPISILLGVVIFLWTKTFLQPWIYSILFVSSSTTLSPSSLYV